MDDGNILIVFLSALISLGLLAMLIINTVSLVSINKKLGKLVNMQAKSDMPSAPYAGGPYYESTPRNYR